MSSNEPWIGVDWGTSNVRAWLAGPSGDVLSSAQSDQGMGRIEKQEYPKVLQQLVDELGRDAQSAKAMVFCGMVGARQGWTEAPYVSVPCELATIGKDAVKAPSDLKEKMFILPGLCQRDGAEDVMRGEETQLLGLLALHPGYEGSVCMPGTHSKWVSITGGHVERFETAMTGELFDLLLNHSVLRHSLAEVNDGPELEAGITAGLEGGLEAPENLTSRLFRTRAASLLSDKRADWCTGYLSGLLVGSEVGAHKSWLGKGRTVLIGSDRLCRLYGAAIRMTGNDSMVVDATQATLAGLNAARESLPA